MTDHHNNTKFEKMSKLTKQFDKESKSFSLVKLPDVFEWLYLVEFFPVCPIVIQPLSVIVY